MGQQRNSNAYIPTLSGTSIPKKRVTMLSDITGSPKPNMAADKPEMIKPFYQHIDVIVLHLKIKIN